MSILPTMGVGFAEPSIPMARNHAIAPFGQKPYRREPQPPQQKFPTWEVSNQREYRVESLKHFS